MSREIYWQRCFRIPTEKLDLFLVKLRFESNDRSHFEASYIFKLDDCYDVVVEEFKSKYPFCETNIENFVRALWQSETDHYPLENIRRTQELNAKLKDMGLQTQFEAPVNHEASDGD